MCRRHDMSCHDIVDETGLQKVCRDARPTIAGSEKVCSGGQGGRFGRAAADLAGIPAGWLEIVDQDLAVDDRRPDVGPAAGVDDRRVRIGAAPVAAIDQDRGRRACRPRCCRSRARGRARARLRASPSQTASRAVSAPGWCRTDCSTAASRISSNMSRWLLQAAPSAPSDTEMPLARISTTGARPEPSFRFDPGQCSTLTPRSAISDCSSSSTHTQWARQRRGEVRPVSAR